MNFLLPGSDLFIVHLPRFAFYWHATAHDALTHKIECWCRARLSDSFSAINLNALPQRFLFAQGYKTYFHTKAHKFQQLAVNRSPPGTFFSLMSSLFASSMSNLVSPIHASSHRNLQNDSLSWTQHKGYLTTWLSLFFVIWFLGCQIQQTRRQKL